jgi:hypothetical protein
MPEASRTRRVELDGTGPVPEAAPVTRVQLKFTRAALEKLFSEHVELETIIGHQAVKTIVERFGNQILDRVTSIDAGPRIQAYVRQFLTNELRPMVEGEVRAYIRSHTDEINGMIVEEVARQVPITIETAVRTALQSAAERVLRGGT